MGVRSVDVVIVSYNSRDRLRGCVEPLSEASGRPDDRGRQRLPRGEPQRPRGLDVTTIALDRNEGFAAGCNAGGARAPANTCCSSTQMHGSIQRPSSGSPTSSTPTRRRDRCAADPRARWVARLLTAPVPAAPFDIRPRPLLAPDLPRGGLDERARRGRARLRAARQPRLGFGGMSARAPLPARAARRLGRRVLHVLRGQGSLPPRARRGPRRPLRAGGRRHARRRRLGATRGLSPTLAHQPAPLCAQARALAARGARARGRRADRADAHGRRPRRPRWHEQATRAPCAQRSAPSHVA